MIYRLTTFGDICSKAVKSKTLLRAVQVKPTFYNEANTICRVRTWGNFSPDNILSEIDGEYIGEKTFDEIALVLDTLNELKELLKLEWDFSSIDIEYNGVILVTVTNCAVVTNQTLVVDINEWCRQMHFAVKPTFYQRWQSVIDLSVGFFAGLAAGLFLQTRIKY